MKLGRLALTMLTDAIAAFAETLATPDSRFDTGLNGDKKGLGAKRKAG